MSTKRHDAGSSTVPNRVRLGLGAVLLLSTLVLGLVVGTSRWSDADGSGAAVQTRAGSESAQADADADPEIGSENRPAPSQEAATPADPESLVGKTRRLETALDIPALATGARPVSMTFPSIGVVDSAIDAVGVEPNGELEVPGPTRVGWYEYGPRPGQNGSAVLAAHIASDGIDGVFRYLDEVSAGDEFRVTFDDGSSADYQVVELSQYDKDELPLDRVFAKDGPPVITLITCGGDFQPSVRSYEDNVVAYAVPIES